MPGPLPAADTGAGSPVLLVHGQPGSAGDWDGVVEALAGDHRVLVPDRPGYGNSGRPATTMAGNVDAMAELLDSSLEPGGRRAMVVGHSYGGGIALLLAARHPELVRGLVLVGSVGIAGSVNRFDRMLALPVVGDVLSATGLLALGRVLPRLRRPARRIPGEAGAWMAASLPDERYLGMGVGLRRQLWRSFLAEQRNLVAEITVVESILDHLEVPAVVMAGTMDVVVPPTVAVRLARRIPEAELVIVGRSGHFLARDHPRLVARALRRLEVRTET